MSAEPQKPEAKGATADPLQQQRERALVAGCLFVLIGLVAFDWRVACIVGGGGLCGSALYGMTRNGKEPR